MQKELTGLLNLMQEPKGLREAVSSLCKKYGKSADMTAAASMEEENENKKALEEILRQKAFLERLYFLILFLNLIKLTKSYILFRHPKYSTPLFNAIFNFYSVFETITSVLMRNV